MAIDRFDGLFAFISVSSPGTLVVVIRGRRCCDHSGKLRFGLMFPSLTFFSGNGGAKFLEKLEFV
jgi:hypothetical protein